MLPFKKFSDPSEINEISALDKNKQINLAQGLCDFPAPPEIKKSSSLAIEENFNMYSPTEGIIELRTTIAKKLRDFNQLIVDPITQLLVTHGATGAFVCATMALFNFGDEVILFEPFYLNHKEILEFHGVHVKGISIQLENFYFCFDELQSQISKKTRGIVICNPSNPCGKVFSKDELLKIGEIARKNKLWVISDEIYEYITYPGYSHISFASLQNHQDFTVTISGFSKTYQITGWRLGYATAPSNVIKKMTAIQDLLYVCAPTPLQQGIIEALNLPDIYYISLRHSYLLKRDFMIDALIKMGFTLSIPQGACYIFADCSKFFDDDEEATSKILRHAHVALTPGRNFYFNKRLRKCRLRFCYAVEQNKLQQAIYQMQCYFSSMSQ